MQSESVSKQIKGFNRVEGNIGGIPVVLFNPVKDVDEAVPWTEENMLLRSSMWNLATGEAVSLGFQKFFNYGEATHLVPDPTDEDLQSGELFDKLDGSCLIVSNCNGTLVTRTRGTLSALQQPNGWELEKLKAVYPQLFDVENIPEDHSFVFEWRTPWNVIVVPAKTSELTLLAVIYHYDYMMLRRPDVEDWAKVLNVPVVKRGPSFKTITELLAHLETVENIEGYCLYYNQGQTIKKFKSKWYLERHRIKSHLTRRAVFDLYVSYRFNPADVLAYLSTLIDHECLQFVKDVLEEVDGLYKSICVEVVVGCDYWMRNKELSRKELAEQVKRSTALTEFEKTIVLAAAGNKQTDLMILRKLKKAFKENKHASNNE